MKPRRTNAPQPSSQVAAILLAGWGAKPLDGGTHNGFGGGLLELSDDEGLVRLWQQHEPFLRAEADRYGVKPSYENDDGTLLFYGEYVRRTQGAETTGTHSQERRTDD